MWGLIFKFFHNIIRPHNDKSGKIERQQHTTVCTDWNIVQIFFSLALHYFDADSTLALFAILAFEFVCDHSNLNTICEKIFFVNFFV